MSGDDLLTYKCEILIGHPRAELVNDGTNDRASRGDDTHAHVTEAAAGESDLTPRYEDK